MRLKRDNILTGFQTIMIMSSSYLPLIFWSFAQIAVAHAGFDAQWSVLGVLTLGVLIAWIHGSLNERFPNLDGVQMLERLYGKWVGKLYAGLYVPIYLGFISLSLYFFASILKIFFTDTPRSVIVLLVCLVAWRGAWFGISALAQVASIIHSLTLLGTFISFFYILVQSQHWWIPHTITHWNSVWNGTYHLLPLYLGFNFTLMISPNYLHQKKEQSGIPSQVFFSAESSSFWLLPR
ncbi:hypothetical protein D2Q93_02770 [Alicyclobacillaceae bacterium I2511]|nr:hypothetical protein D2Q93_02770 [Alicyclobacillaceae bacterium I2511]